MRTEYLSAHHRSSSVVQLMLKLWTLLNAAHVMVFGTIEAPPKDSVYKKLKSNSVGAEKHSAVPFSKKEENEKWKQGVMGKQSPTALMRAVFF